MPLPIRVLVTIGLLALVLVHVEWKEVIGALNRAGLSWIAIALLAFNAATLAAARRWQVIVAAAKGSGSPVGYGSAVSATYVSLWLSNFLPTAFGGDIARVLTAHRAGSRMPTAVAGAVLDRYVGLMTLAILFFVSEAVSAASGHARPLFSVAALLAAGSATLLIVMWGGSHMPIPRRWLRLRAVRFAARSIGLLRLIGSKPGPCVRIAGASVVAIMLGILAYWAAIRSLSPAAGIAVALAVAALGTMASALPISLNGWGVREGTVAVVLAKISDLSAGDASLVALLNGVVMGVTSLIGLLFFLAGSWDLRSRAALRERRSLDDAIGPT